MYIYIYITLMGNVAIGKKSGHWQKKNRGHWQKKAVAIGKKPWPLANLQMATGKLPMATAFLPMATNVIKVGHKIPPPNLSRGVGKEAVAIGNHWGGGGGQGSGRVGGRGGGGGGCGCEKAVVIGLSKFVTAFLNGHGLFCPPPPPPPPPSLPFPTYPPLLLAQTPILGLETWVWVG